MEHKIIAVIDAPTGLFIAKLAEKIGAVCSVHPNLPEGFKFTAAQAMLSIIHDMSPDDAKTVKMAATRGARILLLKQDIATRSHFNLACDALTEQNPNIQSMTKAQFITGGPLEILKTFLPGQRA